MSSRNSTCPHRIPSPAAARPTLPERGWVIVALLLLTVAGCGSSDPEIDLQDPLRTLAMLEAEQQLHAADLYMEVELGEFFIVKKLPDSPYGMGISCHLFGVIPIESQAEFEAILANRRQRMRDRVIEQVQLADVDVLTGSDLEILKADLLTTCRKTLETNLLQRVVISDFSVQQH